MLLGIILLIVSIAVMVSAKIKSVILFLLIAFGAYNLGVFIDKEKYHKNEGRPITKYTVKKF